jgi:hypothetical protein
MTHNGLVSAHLPNCRGLLDRANARHSTFLIADHLLVISEIHSFLPQSSLV